MKAKWALRCGLEQEVLGTEWSGRAVAARSPGVTRLRASAQASRDAVSAPALPIGRMGRSSCCRPSTLIGCPVGACGSFRRLHAGARAENTHAQYVCGPRAEEESKRSCPTTARR
jgi:hypothetical protein